MNIDSSISQLIQPMSRLKAGIGVIAVLFDGTRIEASSTKIVSQHFNGIFLYAGKPKRMIPPDLVAGWVPRV